MHEEEGVLELIRVRLRLGCLTQVDGGTAERERKSLQDRPRLVDHDRKLHRIERLSLHEVGTDLLHDAAENLFLRLDLLLVDEHELPGLVPPEIARETEGGVVSALSLCLSLFLSLSFSLLRLAPDKRRAGV